MKYFTLVAAMSLASAGAFAAQPFEIVGAQKIQRSLTPEQMQNIEVQSAPLTDVELNTARVEGVVKAAQPKADGSIIPFYNFSNQSYTGIIFNEDGSMNWYNGFSYGGAFTELTWQNLTRNLASSEWTFGDQTFSSTDFTTVCGYPLTKDLLTFPTLTATNTGGNVGTYTQTVTDSDGEVSTTIYLAGGSPELFGLPELPMTTIPVIRNGGDSKYPFSALGGYYEGADQIYEGSTAENPGYITGYMQRFPKTSSPYTISNVKAMIYQEAPEGTDIEPYTLTVSIYPIIDNQILRPIATGEALVSSVNDGLIDVDLVAIDEEGLEIEEPITIDSEIFVGITGFYGVENLTAFQPMSSNTNRMTLTDFYANDNYWIYPNNAFLMVEYPAQNIVKFHAPNSLWYLDKTQTAVFSPDNFAVFIDAFFNWCTVVEGTTEIVLPKEGGRQEFKICCYDPNAEEITGPDWIGFDFIEQDQETAYITCYVEAEAFDGEGREGYLTFSSPGQADLDIHIVQGTASVAGVEMGKDVKSVEFFDLMGRKLTEQPVNGMYIQKQVMTDGSTRTAKLAK